MSMGIENHRVIEVMALLAEKWPACFSIYEGRRRPLRIGIHQEIAAALGDSVNAGELHAALHRYTRNSVYLSRLQDGRARFDLGGEIAGHVTAAQAAMAAAELQRRSARAAAKKAATKPRAPSAAPVSVAPVKPPVAPKAVSSSPAKARASLADLKEAALARRRASAAA